MIARLNSSTLAARMAAQLEGKMTNVFYGSGGQTNAVSQTTPSLTIERLKEIAALMPPLYPKYGGGFNDVKIVIDEGYQEIKWKILNNQSNRYRQEYLPKSWLGRFVKRPDGEVLALRDGTLVMNRITERSFRDQIIPRSKQ